MRRILREAFVSLDLFLKWVFVRLDSWAGGLILLGVSFLLGLTKLFYWQFVDEGNNLVYGWLISRGLVIYRDVFSQHFPLAYFWTAGVVSIFGNSQAIARISILVLQFVVFAYCMRVTRFYLPIGITALAWGLTSQFHRGNLVLYDTFDGIFLTAAAILVFSILLERSQVKQSMLIVIGLLLGCTMLSNPLLIYPSAIAIAGIGLSVIGLAWKQAWRESLRRIVWVALSIGVVVGAFGLYLLITGAGPDFYRDVIWFNANVYNQYTDANPVRLGVIVYQLTHALNVFAPQFRQTISPFVGFEVANYRLADEGLYYSWIFSSLTFRLSILLCAVSLLLHRKVLPAVFLYVFSATLLIRAETSWHTIPFIWLSLFAGAYVLVKMTSPPASWTTIPDQASSWKSRLAWLGRFSWRAVYFILLVLYSWSAIRGGQFLIQNRRVWFNRDYLHELTVFGGKVRQLACDQPDVELLVYPYDPLTYFVTEIPPASRYTFMHPWVAQIALQEVIEELKNNPSAVVQINTKRTIWGEYRVKDYMADLIQFLNQNYTKVSDRLWKSPELTQRCGANPP